MKILEENKLNRINADEWKDEIRCDKCTSLLEINKDDVIVAKPCACSMDELYVICPVCGSLINISDKNVPFEIKRTAKRREFEIKEDNGLHIMQLVDQN